jgi:hypothetical protein
MEVQAKQPWWMPHWWPMRWRPVVIRKGDSVQWCTNRYARAERFTNGRIIGKAMVDVTAGCWSWIQKERL